MTQRYFVDSLSPSGGLFHLQSSEAQHAFRVMRLAVGDELTLFDGQGNEAPATVFQIGRNECVCEAKASLNISREAAVQLHLAIAIPKGDRAKEMLMRLTELGVSEVTPITASRSQRPVRENVTEKFSRLVIEASKQCGRNSLLQIREAKTLPEFLKSLEKSDEGRWILHTRVNEQRETLAPKSGKLIALVGPEGGWADADLRESFEQGFTAVSLGPRILRIETAATAIAAIVCCR